MPTLKPKKPRTITRSAAAQERNRRLKAAKAARSEAPKTAKAAREEMRRNLISGNVGAIGRVVSDPLFKVARSADNPAALRAIFKLIKDAPIKAARSAATPSRRRAARKKK